MSEENKNRNKDKNKQQNVIKYNTASKRDAELSAEQNSEFLNLDNKKNKRKR
ncbi:hypothetical protein ACLIBH_14200 [Virgibacillus sp. W0430]|uniref:hypothetical protein n=1 Tax=Virgibacillus sp. W0430 TaxID=3391580 RepID=UPI003F46F7E7